MSCQSWIKGEVWRVPSWVAGQIGRDGVEGECWLAVCKAAADWDPVKYPGVPFGAFARLGVRRHLMGIRGKLGIKLRVWQGMPVTDEGWSLSGELASHRPGPVWPALSAWCSEDYRDQRRCLHPRMRLILYLRGVEGWTLEEVGDVFGIRRERVRQIEERSIRRLAQYRVRKQIRGAQ